MKDAFIEVLKMLRLERCCYSLGNHQADRCDCKFHRPGEPLTWGETSNGCPELFTLIRHVENMTDEEFRAMRTN